MIKIELLKCGICGAGSVTARIGQHIYCMACLRAAKQKLIDLGLYDENPIFAMLCQASGDRLHVGGEGGYFPEQYRKPGRPYYVIFVPIGKGFAYRGAYLPESQKGKTEIDLDNPG